MKTQALQRLAPPMLALALWFAISCKSGPAQLTPAMKEYRLSEMTDAVASVNSQGLISSVSGDDSTLIVALSENWPAASVGVQNQLLEALGAQWTEISKKIGIKESELGRLRVVAVDRLQKEQARWTRRAGVQRPAP